MKEFFDSLRSSFGPLSTNQVKGIEHLLKATVGLPINHRAYVLATTWHETGPAASSLHMTPRREIWGPTKAQTGYEFNKDLGNTIAGDGKRFMGRGYVQLTGRRNYNRASLLTGKDLVQIPDLALDPDLAATIMVDGMLRGWFTGKKLSDYDSYREMRRVVNGTDKADLIADYARRFEMALKLLPVNNDPPSPPKEIPPTVIVTPVVEPSPAEATNAAKGIAGAVAAFVAAIIAALAYWITRGG